MIRIRHSETDRDGQIDRQTNGKLYRHKKKVAQDRQTQTHENKQPTKESTNMAANRQTDGRTDVQTGRDKGSRYKLANTVKRETSVHFFIFSCFFYLGPRGKMSRFSCWLFFSYLFLFIFLAHFWIYLSRLGKSPAISQQEGESERATDGTRTESRENYYWRELLSPRILRW